jgi:hypothetical protein
VSINPGLKSETWATQPTMLKWLASFDAHWGNLDRFIWGAGGLS